MARGLPLVGREAQVTSLRAHVDAVVGGAGRAVVLVGEAGIGKSRLIDEIGRHGETNGCRWLRSSAVPGESGYPFGALMELAEQLGIDPMAAASMGAYGLFRALSDRLEEESGRMPLVVTLDDLHWADVPTIGVIGRLALRLPLLRLLLVCGTRTDPQPPELVEALDRLRRDGATFLELGRLSVAEVEELASAIIDATPTDALRSQLDATGGNPLLVIELLEAHRAAGTLVAGEVVAGDVLPPTLRAAVMPRVDALADETKELLTVLAVVGSQADVADLATLLGLDAGGAAGHLDRAAQAGLVDRRAGTVWFRHDLLARVVYENVGDAVRRARHRDVARLLIARGGHPEAIARHLEHSGERGPALAEWALRAGQELLADAPAEAVVWLRRATAELVPGTKEWRSARRALGAAVLAAGDPDCAVDILQPAFASGEAPELDDVLVVLQALMAARRWDELAPFVHDVVERLDPADRPRFRAEAAFAFACADDVAAAVAAAPDHSDSVLYDAHTEVVRLRAAAVVASFSGDVTTCRDANAAAVAAAEREGSPDVLRRAPYAVLSMAERYYDRLDASVDAAKRGIEVAEALAAPWDLPLLHVALGQSLYALGEVDEAVGEWEAALVAIAEGGTPVPQAMAHVHLGRVAVRRDDLQGAASHLAALASLRSLTGAERALSDSVAAVVAEASGDVAGASDWALSSLEGILDSGQPLLLLSPAHDLVRILLAGGKFDFVRLLSAGVTALQDAAGGNAWIEATAARVRGLIDGDVDQLELAARLFERSKRPLELAAVHEDVGRLLLERDDKRAAAPVLEAALQMWERARFVRDARRMASVARRAGIHFGTRRGQAQATHGWDSVTEAERRVLELVIEGLTSRAIGERLFISRRTVESHLARMFTKLGVRSRAELVALAVRSGANPAFP